MGNIGGAGKKAVGGDAGLKEANQRRLRGIEGQVRGLKKRVEVERDPVCGMSVAPEKAAATVEFAGKKYFFCAKSCAAKFEKEPKKYLSGKLPEGMGGMGHGGELVSIGGAQAGSVSPIKKSGGR